MPAKNGQLTVQEVDRVLEHLRGQQVSTVVIQETIRGYAVECIQTLVDIMRNGKMDNSRLGAAKTLLAKVAPDLKAVEITDTNQLKGLVIIKSDTSTEIQEANIVTPDVPDNPISEK